MHKNFFIDSSSGALIVEIINRRFSYSFSMLKDYRKIDFSKFNPQELAYVLDFEITKAEDEDLAKSMKKRELTYSPENLIYLTSMQEY